MKNVHIILRYIPFGWSEPQESDFFGGPGDAVDYVLGNALDWAWDQGEPVEAQDSDTGATIWESARYF